MIYIAIVSVSVVISFLTASLIIYSLHEGCSEFYSGG